MHIGVLTGGGDCPGLNAVLRAVVVTAIKHYNWRVTGVLEGWRGLLERGMTREMRLNDVAGILARGGTILKTSRTNPAKVDNGYQIAADRVRRLGLDAVIAIGGDDTLGVAHEMTEIGVPMIGVPKTIDNDIFGTDSTFGFDTAVNTVIDAIDRVRTTTESHKRVMVVEVMGRHAGWIALHGGIAGGADYLLIPERDSNVQEICEVLRKRHEGDKDFSIVVVAEGAHVALDPESESKHTYITQDTTTDDFGHVRLGGIGQILAQEIEKVLGIETRTVMLGHVQRGGAPSAYDRYLCTRFGIHAVRFVDQKKFGHMVSLRGNDIVGVPLADIAGKNRTVTNDLYQEAALFFG
ncbi:MAG: ATP-dependent 6-phosphofructokinase [candidate division Zixibacteria bacterium]|nr:ATP-dependent 6-phosphofructokinase [candidate division Zixibacteria bacterium]